MFQPQRPAVDNQGIKPITKIDESRAIKKPDTAAGRPARAAYEPIELPPSYPSGLFKVSESHSLSAGILRVRFCWICIPQACTVSETLGRWFFC